MPLGADVADFAVYKRLYSVGDPSAAYCTVVDLVDPRALAPRPPPGGLALYGIRVCDEHLTPTDETPDVGTRTPGVYGRYT